MNTEALASSEWVRVVVDGLPISLSKGDTLELRATSSMPFNRLLCEVEKMPQLRIGAVDHINRTVTLYPRTA